MGKVTEIQWTHHTFNPWRGCSKVSPGCANCYAERESKRNPGVLGIWGPEGSRVVASEAKKVYEAKVIALRSITRSQPGPQREFPFAGEQGAESSTNEPLTQAESVTQAASFAEPIESAEPQMQDAAADERSWRAWPLAQVAGIPAKKLDKLTEAGIVTVGQLADLTNKHGLFWFRDIKGIGEAMAAKIAEAVERFHMERPDRKQNKEGTV